MVPLPFCYTLTSCCLPPRDSRSCCSFTHLFILSFSICPHYHSLFLSLSHSFFLSLFLTLTLSFSRYLSHSPKFSFIFFFPFSLSLSLCQYLYLSLFLPKHQAITIHIHLILSDQINKLCNIHFKQCHISHLP